MLQAIQYMKGYLCIRVWGFSVERFMNLCGNHNILLWNIENHGDYFTMCITLKGFYSLKSITRKTGTRVVITKRCGLPFFSQRAGKRKIFVAGIFLSFLFWIWMESFLLDIEISGNYFITEEVFTDFLRENNITPGMKKKEIDIEALEKAIRNEYELVTWTSAKIEGTRLLIALKENDLIQNKTEEANPDDAEGYHLIADADGIVTDMITRTGVPMVGIGTEVKKGDVLVEGCIPIYQEDTTVKRYEYCKADADVVIERQISVTEKKKESYEKKIYTGEMKVRHFVRFPFGEIKIPIFHIPYECYDILEEEKQLQLFGGMEFPAFYGKKQVREYRLEEAIYTKEEIKNSFEQKIQKFLQTLEEKGVQIIEKNVTISKHKGIWSLKAEFTVRQKADSFQKIQE